MAGLLELLRIELCVHVMVTPDDKRIIVLRRGIEKGLIGSTNIGGQEVPVSIDGARALWKKAQKNAKKNITSDEINNNMLIFKWEIIEEEWWPV